MADWDLDYNQYNPSSHNENPRNDRQLGESENERRKRSFVVIGLAELPIGTENEIHEEDYIAANDIIRYLGVPDGISRTDVKRARNGPARERNLIVTMESVASRDRILKRSHFLADNEGTRHLKISRAFTAEQMIRRYGHLPRDGDFDNPNSDFNRINRPNFHNGNRRVNDSELNQTIHADYGGGQGGFFNHPNFFENNDNNYHRHQNNANTSARNPGQSRRGGHHSDNNHRRNPRGNHRGRRY